MQCKTQQMQLMDLCNLYYTIFFQDFKWMKLTHGNTCKTAVSLGTEEN
jgi:hypothetical protein